MPNGVLFASTNAATGLREMLLTECDLQAVIGLPSGIFKPYAGVATAALVFQKGKPTNSVWFYDITADGFSFDDKRSPIDTNDIPDVVAKWPKREESPNSYQVPIEKIKRNDWSLAAGRYKANTAKPTRNSRFTYPTVMLGELLEMADNERIGKDQQAPVMSITMEYGLIDQADKFKKRIASADISNYKKVYRNQLVVGFPIDEGVLGFQTKYDFAAVSPAYMIWKLKHTDIDIEYLEMILRSLSMRKIYRSKMQGAVDRRRSIPKDVFLTIRIPVPPKEIQKEVVLKRRAIEKAAQTIKTLEKEVEQYVDNLLGSEAM